MPKQPPNHQPYSSGIIKPARNKSRRGYDCYLRVDGKDHRARHRTIEAAKAWILETEDALSANRPPLTRLQLSDAAHALAILPGGYTLTDAARALAVAGERHAAKVVRLDAAIADYLRARKGFVGPRTMQGYENTLGRFERFAGGVVQDVAPHSIEQFIAGMGGETRNSKLRHLAAFFHWAVGKEMIDKAPTDRIERAQRTDTEIHVLSVEDAATLVWTAAKVKSAMVAYFGLALFAGIRPEELARLPVNKIGADFVMLDGKIAKKKRRRTIPIRPNLRAWLDQFPPAGPLVRFSRREFRAVVEASGVEWHPDIMRHSFGTYAFEVSKDAMLISSEMGNSPDVFFAHYRALAAPGAGAEYFGIWPACRFSATPPQRPAKTPTKARKKLHS